MMKTIFVKSQPGVPCPREGSPREYVSDAAYEEVPSTPYYRRRIEDGSLLIRPEANPKVDIKTKGGKR